MQIEPVEERKEQDDDNSQEDKRHHVWYSQEIQDNIQRNAGNGSSQYQPDEPFFGDRFEMVGVIHEMSALQQGPLYTFLIVFYRRFRKSGAFAPEVADSAG